MTVIKDLLAVLLLVAVVAPAQALEETTALCGAGGYCQIPFDGGSRYMVALPWGWDGTTPLPAVIYFHGAGGSAEGVMGREDLVAAITARGAMLIAGEAKPSLIRGRQRRVWYFRGSFRWGTPGQRDEAAYVDAVLADVAARWPLDQSRILASGFSVGGTVVWELACWHAESFAAFAPVAGHFWRPHPTRCPSGPVPVRHVHGTQDGTFPLEGRSIFDGAAHQGSATEGMAYLRRHNGAGEDPTRITERDGLRCQIWEDGSAPLQFCLHGGGHTAPAQYVGQGLDWMLALTADAICPGTVLPDNVIATVPPHGATAAGNETETAPC